MIPALTLLLIVLTPISVLALGGIERPFTRLPGEAFNLGPTGARLWATYVNARPGMEGSFEFIHKVNVPRLFAINVDVDGGEVTLELRSHKWYPSHLETTFEGGGIRLTESKFITWDDCAVDVISLQAASQSPKTVRLRITCGSTQKADPARPEWSFRTHGAEVHVATAGNLPEQAVTVESGSTQTWRVAAALALSQDEARSAARKWISMSDPLGTHKAEYDGWFEDLPQFHCSDPAFERMWEYRWYLARRNLADPRLGGLPHPLFYEGRGAKMTLDPWDPKGWEFSKLIAFSTPFHLLEGRWKRDASACKGEILNLVRNQAETGAFPWVYIDRAGGGYTDFVAWSIWQLYLVHPDKQWLAQAAPAAIKQVDGILKAHDPDGDFLPVVTNHNSTGKEYQPSFFHKAGYPKDPKTSEATPLERVDAACYLYLNASAASAIMAELGDDKEARRMSDIAREVKSAVLERMWDPQKEFFYDIDAVEHDRIPVENVVGFDPFFADIADSTHLSVFDRLRDPQQFGTKWPVPSTTRRSPVYAPDASWKGVHVKGEHGAMWNGPTWPFTNSTVLMALGNASLASGHKLDSLFAQLLKSYTMMCFRDGDIDRPIIYEHYNPETGHPISQEEDYYHSSWIDLLVRYVAGITPLRGGEVEFSPIDCGFESFSLHGVYVGSHRVDVDYSRKDGYVAKVDGQVIDRRAGIFP